MLHVGNLDARRDITDVRDTVRAYRARRADGARRTAVQRLQRTRPSHADLLEILLSGAQVKIRVEVDPARLRPSDNPSRARQPCAAGQLTPAGARQIPIEQTLADLLDYWRGLTQTRDAVRS